MSISPTINSELIYQLKLEFQLGWDSIHGIRHWKRVRENGLFLAEGTGADIKVIELFAFLHDIKREDEGYDPQHGERAAAFATSINNDILMLEQSQLALLNEACFYHHKGRTDGPLTARICYDADRLDLARVGIIPDPQYLCTKKAKQKKVIDWAVERSREY
ncbi:MAG: hypothetical protein R2753_18075 [Chitinophagales bacterium]